MGHGCGLLNGTGAGITGFVGIGPRRNDVQLRAPIVLECGGMGEIAKLWPHDLRIIARYRFGSVDGGRGVSPS